MHISMDVLETTEIFKYHPSGRATSVRGPTMSLQASGRTAAACDGWMKGRTTSRSGVGWRPWLRDLGMWSSSGCVDMMKDGDITLK